MERTSLGFRVVEAEFKQEKREKQGRVVRPF